MNSYKLDELKSDILLIYPLIQIDSFKFMEKYPLVNLNIWGKSINHFINILIKFKCQAHLKIILKVKIIDFSIKYLTHIQIISKLFISNNKVKNIDTKKIILKKVGF